MPIAPSEVAMAGCSRNCVNRRSNGTVIRPPPTPNSALKKPATTPITARRNTARIVWAMDALDRLRAEAARAAVLLDIDGTLAPIVDRPEDAAVPEETRAVLRDLVERYAL